MCPSFHLLKNNRHRAIKLLQYFAVCQGKEADVVIIVDMSSSIWVEDFKSQLKFLSDLISHFDIDSGKTRVSSNYSFF